MNKENLLTVLTVAFFAAWGAVVFGSTGGLVGENFFSHLKSSFVFIGAVAGAVLGIVAVTLIWMAGAKNKKAN